MAKTLEQRYRRLLAWYPAEHHSAFGEEMLGLLLDSVAGPGRAGSDRVRPTAAETVDLLAGALCAWMRRIARTLAEPHWREAAAVLSVLAPAALLSIRLWDLCDTTGIGVLLSRGISLPGGDRIPIGPSLWVPPVAWALVTLAVLADRRRLATALASAALAVELGVQGLTYLRFWQYVRPPVWTILLALVAALSLAAGAGPRDGLRDGLRLLGRRRIAVLIAIGGYLTAGKLLDNAYGWALPSWSGWPVRVAPFVLALVACVVTVARLGRPVRRRLLIVLVPLGLVALLENGAGLVAGPAQYAYLGRGPGSPFWLAPAQSLGLLLLALVTAALVTVALVTVAPGTVALETHATSRRARQSL